jgi:hypothetical protein
MSGSQRTGGGMSASLDVLLRKAGRCPACCAETGSCDCVSLPGEFRALGFTGLFHAEATASAETIDTWEPRMPCLISGDRWVAVSADRERGVITAVRRDDTAMCEAFLRPAAGAR